MPPDWNPGVSPLRGRIVVVGGQCSKVGKTALIVDLLSIFRDEVDRGWTAVKVTPHLEDECPINGRECRCGPAEHGFAVRDEEIGPTATDTGRFLLAGARRALWVQTKPGRLPEALPNLTRSLAPASHIIIESNAILEFWRPAAVFMVLDASNSDFKPSARNAIPFVDAFVLRSPFRPSQSSAWLIPALSSKPTFLQFLGEPFPAGMQGLARQLLGLPSASS